MAFLRDGRPEDAPRARSDPAGPQPAPEGRREVLAQVKADDELKTIPTIILTTSDAQADIVRSYELQANSYLTKPTELDRFESLSGASTTSG